MTATKTLFASLEHAPAVQSLRQRVEKGGVFSCAAVAASALPFLAVLARQMFPGRTVVVVTDGVKSQESVQQDVDTWLRVAREELGIQPAASTGNSLFYPAWEILPHEDKLPHVDVISERLETLIALTRGSSNQSPDEEPTPNEPPAPSPRPSPPVGEREMGRALIGPSPWPAVTVVTNVIALLQRTFAPKTIRQQTRHLNRGERIDPLDLVEWLEDLGYEPETQVNSKGEIALRGGILDVFPLSSPWPVRLEFFGDELESLRYFDPITQMSKEGIESVTLPPAGELSLLKRKLSAGASEAGATPEAGGAAPKPSPSPPSGERVGVRGHTVRSIPSPSRNAPIELATLIDYLPPDTLFLLWQPDVLSQLAEDYARQIPAGDAFLVDWAELREQITARGMSVLELDDLDLGVSGEMSFSLDSEIKRTARPLTPTLSPGGGEGGETQGDMLGFQSLDAFRPLGAHAPDPQIAEAQRREFFSQLHRWLRQGYAVHVFCNNDGERQRFEEIWEEYGLVRAERPFLHLGALTRGFLCESAKLVVVTDAEIFGRYKVQRPRRLKSAHAQTSRSLLDIDFTDLEEGDYVVHFQYGIGRYLGLQPMPISAGEKPLEKARSTNDGTQECLVIEYAPSGLDEVPPKLHVPVNEAHLISKYVGAGKARPSLNTLGGGRWAKTKEQAEHAVRDLAGELLSIQAARESQAGHAFAPDVPWQREFESAFLFEETPDQMRAIVQTKTDMEMPKPMDRLICGDVGYGKTEVAIRAAFKAVMSGRQVAVLVPTTILAQQHFNTFRERMADYPVRIELLSRFRTHRQQQLVLKQLAAGSVDIVIGTHRLVQSDVAFKDLGLVVVDEEQRFGVLQKEKFKQLRKLVDVLTLSATPIPRTLYLALTGARDMSTIETPPQDRLPVETIVGQYDERLIRDAIQREMNRGGQVFYLHNRVFDIETVAERLRALLPKARIVVGHGQMESDELEEVMTRFVNGEADVLLSTTIIESGLDIPNANTIIINRADRFGLSDLYQLRGRVGRYKHQAYAYLLVPRHATMLTDARKRISAIKQYSNLGSGFKIAMRDLEIRGAGNLLGPQQSGHITAVGFDLYCQLLQQSVSALKGEKVKRRIEVETRLDFLDLTEGKSSIQYSVSSVQSKGSNKRATPSAVAAVPLSYISDSRQRIEVYRKLAQISDTAAAETLRAELRDRFGPFPLALELMLEVATVRVLAGERGISAIETKDDKLMLTRNNDYIMLKGKFPRLIKKDAKARLGEIKRWLKTI